MQGRSDLRYTRMSYTASRVLDLVRMYHNFTRHTNLPVYQGVHEYRGRILHEHALLAVLHQSTVGIHRAGSFREPYSRTRMRTVQRVHILRYSTPLR